CGRGDDVTPLPPPDAHDFPAAQRAATRREAVTWLGRHARPFWPLAMRADDPDALDYEALVDPAGRSGEARLDAHYVRIHIDPSEAQPRAPAAPAPRRLRRDRSGFDSLVLAGDWTRSGIDLGCVESAVMSGLQASRAISGHPQSVFGERDITLPRLVPRRR